LANYVGAEDLAVLGCRAEPSRLYNGGPVDMAVVDDGDAHTDADAGAESIVPCPSGPMRCLMDGGGDLKRGGDRLEKGNNFVTLGVGNHPTAIVNRRAQQIQVFERHTVGHWTDASDARVSGIDHGSHQHCHGPIGAPLGRWHQIDATPARTPAHLGI
jgi:hypothetical protein